MIDGWATGNALQLFKEPKTNTKRSDKKIRSVIPFPLIQTEDLYFLDALYTGLLPQSTPFVSARTWPSLQAEESVRCDEKREDHRPTAGFHAIESQLFVQSPPGAVCAPRFLQK